MPSIDTAFSPCPNDTFMFHAMLNGLVDTGGVSFRPRISDIERLNLDALAKRYPVTKMSFHAYFLIRDAYSILSSGAALGYGCGPLLVAGRMIDGIGGLTVAVPGEYTTANLLLRLWAKEPFRIVVTRFDRILDGVSRGEFDAGVIIHEGRFVYSRYNLVRIVDLGEWWEGETSLPVPLGCIAMRRDGAGSIGADDISSILRASIEYAFKNRESSREFVRRHAGEQDDEIIEQHIKLYVNDFSIDLGDTGRRAIDALEDMARCRGIIK
jgi:1,4-dihydroxy-6-naphthoate synthase